jgi:hypothetical protein
MKEPSAPINLMETVLPATNAFQITWTWEEGIAYFGADVIDFTLSWDEGAGDGQKRLLA